MQYRAIPYNTMQYHAIQCNTMQYQAIQFNAMQHNAIQCNTMQYHSSFITADGAYHRPVGSIWPWLLSSLSSWSWDQSESMLGAIPPVSPATCRSSQLIQLDKTNQWYHPYGGDDSHEVIHMMVMAIVILANQQCSVYQCSHLQKPIVDEIW